MDTYSPSSVGQEASSGYSTTVDRLLIDTQRASSSPRQWIRYARSRAPLEQARDLHPTSSVGAVRLGELAVLRRRAKRRRGGNGRALLRRLHVRGLLAVGGLLAVRPILCHLAGFRRRREADAGQIMGRDVSVARTLGLRRDQDRGRLALRRVTDYAGRRRLGLAPPRCQIGELDRREVDREERGTPGFRSEVSLVTG